MVHRFVYRLLLLAILIVDVIPKYVELSPSNSNSDGASVILDPSKINTDAKVNNNEWQITATSIVGWQIAVDLTNKWGFSSTMKSILEFTIYGTSPVSDKDSDLYIVFSVGASKFVSAVFNMDSNNQNVISGAVCDISTNPTQKFISGDIKTLATTIGRGMHSGVSAKFEPDGGKNDWPLIFTIENDPISNKMFISVTNPKRGDVQKCGFGESFSSNQGLQIFMGNDNNGEYLAIEKFAVSYTTVTDIFGVAIGGHASVELSPSNSDINWASVILDPSKINTDAKVNNNEWQITATSPIGWQIAVDLTNKWGFSSTMKSILEFTIYGTSPPYHVDQDLIIAFSVGSSKFFSAVFNFDNWHKNVISGVVCDTSTNPTQNLISGDIKTLGSTIGRGMHSGIHNMFEPQYAGSSGDNNDWPLIFTIENDPISNKMFVSVTNPKRADVQKCGFGESFSSNKGLQIFMGNDNNGEYVSIAKFGVELTVKTEEIPTDPKSLEYIKAHMVRVLPIIINEVSTVGRQNSNELSHGRRALNYEAISGHVALTVAAYNALNIDVIQYMQGSLSQYESLSWMDCFSSLWQKVGERAIYNLAQFSLLDYATIEWTSTGMTEKMCNMIENDIKRIRQHMLNIKASIINEIAQSGRGSSNELLFGRNVLNNQQISGHQSLSVAAENELTNVIQQLISKDSSVWNTKNVWTVCFDELWSIVSVHSVNILITKFAITDHATVEWTTTGLTDMICSNIETNGVQQPTPQPTALVQSLPRISIPIAIPQLKPDEICLPLQPRGFGYLPSDCPSDHPDDQGLLCFPNCKSGYTGVLNNCFQDCKDGETDLGLVCSGISPIIITTLKETYDRGVGVIPTDCGSRENSAGLCYAHCKSGYYGVLTVCWENCGSGYTDVGISCFKPLFYWYFKSTYDRGIGTIPNKCPSSKSDYHIGLCYTPCKSGFEGALTVCWQECGPGDVDLGLSCGLNLENTYTKDVYSRGVGVTKTNCGAGDELDALGFLCYPKFNDAVWDCVGPLCVSKKWQTSLLVVLASFVIQPVNLPVCGSLILPLIIENIALFQSNPSDAVKMLNLNLLDECLWPLLSIISGIDQQWKRNEVAVAWEISIGASSQMGGAGFFGIALNFPNDNGMDVYFYGGGCSFMTTSIGASAGVSISTVLYRSIADIPGQCSYFGVGVDVPKTQIGLGLSYGFSNLCDVISMASSAGIGLSAGSDLPISFEGGICIATDLVHIVSLKANQNNRRIRRRNLDDIHMHEMQLMRNSNVDNINDVRQLLTETCFKPLTSKYYAKCHSLNLIHKTTIQEIEGKCLSTPQCIGYTFDKILNSGRIILLGQCSVNSIHFNVDGENEVFYLNTCLRKQDDIFYKNGLVELNKTNINHNNYGLHPVILNEYYTKCPFNIVPVVNVQKVQLKENEKINDEWYNIFTFDYNGNREYPGLFLNYFTKQYKLQIGKYECVSAQINDMFDDKLQTNDIFSISVGCDGKSSLSLNTNELCSISNGFNIYNMKGMDDHEDYDGKLAQIFVSDPDYKSANFNLLSMKATKPIYPWIGYVTNNNNKIGNVVFDAFDERPYQFDVNMLVAPYLKFDGNYLIEIDLYLKLNGDTDTNKIYNIFEIGFNDDLDTKINDIYLDYRDVVNYGLKLGISTSDTKIRHCYNKYYDRFPKNKWNKIKLFIESGQATLIIGDLKGCSIDLRQTPINTHQQMVPLFLASTTRYNPVKGLFRNIKIINNVNKDELNIKTENIQIINSENNINDIKYKYFYNYNENNKNDIINFNDENKLNDTIHINVVNCMLILGLLAILCALSFFNVYTILTLKKTQNYNYDPDY